MGREVRIFDGSRIQNLANNPQGLVKALTLALKVYAAAQAGGNPATIAAAFADVLSKQQALQAAHEDATKESGQ